MNENGNKRANGHADVPNCVSVDVSPEHLNGVVSPVQGGSVLEMHTGLFNLALKRARQSGTLESRPEDVEALTEHACAMAKETYRDKYDPSQNVHDAMLDAEYKRALAQRVEAETAEQHATANLRDAENELARTPEAGPKPDVHLLLIAAFTVAITITVAPTIHDLLTTIDDMLAWFAAILSSACVGFMLTWAILSGRRSKWRWVGVAAGLTLGVGLGAIRFSAVSAAGEKGFAVGLTITEIAIVLLLEFVASGLRTREEEWLPKHAAEMQAIAARDAAQADLSRWKNRLKELGESIARTIALVENRHNRNIQVSELEDVAIKTVLDGYNAGVTENIGRVRSVPYAIRRTV